MALRLLGLVALAAFCPAVAFFAPLTGPCSLQRSGSRGVVTSSAVKMMAGFGAPKEKKKIDKIGSGLAAYRKQGKAFRDIQREGGKVAQVHARVKGTDVWYPVGQVAASEGNVAVAVQGQKRLILSHAQQLHEDLSLPEARINLEAGYSVEEGGEVIICKATYNGEYVGLVLDPMPNGPFYRKVDGKGQAVVVDTSSMPSDFTSKQAS